MLPDSVPVFTKEDILIDENEYEDGDKRTTVGWLKYLFLFQNKGDDYIWIDEQDRRDYKMALDTLKKCGKIQGRVEDWEDRASAKTQASALNKTMRKLEYTEIEYVS